MHRPHFRERSAGWARRRTSHFGTTVTDRSLDDNPRAVGRHDTHFGRLTREDAMLQEQHERGQADT